MADTKPNAIAICAGLESKLRRLYYETAERQIRDNPLMFLLSMRGLYEEAKELSALVLEMTAPQSIVEANAKQPVAKKKVPVPAPTTRPVAAEKVTKKAAPVPAPAAKQSI